MGVAQQNRVKLLNSQMIDRQLAELPRSKHDLIEERKDHAEKQSALRGEIAELKDEIARMLLQVEAIEAEKRAEKARGDAWKLRCKAALKASETHRQSWLRASELLRLAGTEQVARLRELRDMHQG